MKWKSFNKEVAPAAVSVVLHNDASPIPSKGTSTPYSTDTKPGADEPGVPFKNPRLISSNLQGLLDHDDEQTRISLDSLLERSRSINRQRSQSPIPEVPVGLPPPPRGPRRYRTREVGKQAKGSIENTPQSEPALPPPELPPTPPLGDATEATLEGTLQSRCDTPPPMSDEVGDKVEDKGDGEGDKSSEGNDDNTSSADHEAAAHLQRRPLKAHIHTNSHDSSFYPSSVSSHDPPSTAYEPRISISSTIYPSSSYANSVVEFPPPTSNPNPQEPSPDNIYPLDSNDNQRSSPSHESFIDMSSPSTSKSPNDNLYTPIIPTQRIVIPDSADAGHSSHSSPVDRLRRSPLTPQQPPLSPFEVARNLPTSFKPNIKRSASVQPSSSKSSKSSNSSSPTTSPKLTSLLPHNLLASLTQSERAVHSSVLPPTTNNLNPIKRADLVRKNRKLTQLFGQTPASMSFAQTSPDSPTAPSCLPPLTPRRTHSRGALSVMDKLQLVVPLRMTREPDQKIKPEEVQRHSSPLSPMTFCDSFIALEGDTPISPHSGGADLVFEAGLGEQAVAWPISERNLSHPDEDFNEGTSSHRLPTLEHFHASRVLRSPSTPSLVESLTDEQIVEEEKRRKREKLAKLHRYLGSRVPPDLVLGPATGIPLPDVKPVVSANHSPASDGDIGNLPKNSWKPRRRRSSSAAAFPLHWSDDTERIKDELNDKEKAVNVRRALKMEKMFGAQPPQRLYHTRQGTPIVIPIAKSPDDKPDERVTSWLAATPSSAPTSPTGRNLNRSAYLKSKKKSNDRPGTADSNTGLLQARDSQILDLGGANDTLSRAVNGQDFAETMTPVYMHYRHSLNSLTDIVNRDDKQSLVELHDFLKSETAHQDIDEDEDDPNLCSPPTAPSVRVERRRSLPLQPSISSLASEYTLTSPKPEVTEFQIRRRRVAKLTHFFGVNYRDLLKEVLDSIELGVKEDVGRGTLRADEAQDLLLKLRRLKVRREEIA